MEKLAGILAATLQEMKDHSSRRTTSSALIELPKFDPSSDDRGASKWCDEIEKLGATFHWLEHEQLSRAASSLVGEAKEWFPLWQPTEKSWENFRTEISNMYPPKRNLHEKFRKASLYVSGDASSYSEYARKKIALIKSLNFTMTENQLLELVIGDIGDVHVKTAAFNSNVKSEAELLVLLSNYKMTNRAPVSHNKLKRDYPFDFKSNDVKLCFNCDKPGHLSRNCKEPRKIAERNNSRPKFEKSKVICSWCNKPGHVAEKCFAKK
jgi:hypothetical protein